MPKAYRSTAAAVWLGTVALSILPEAASAQPADVSASAGIVSDYRFRGVSASDRAPSLQAAIDVETRDGLIAGVSGATIAEFQGTDAEIDLYAGIHRRLGKFDVMLVASGFLYPGGRGTDTYEFDAIVFRDLGFAASETILAVAPRQPNADRANIYVGETLDIPILSRGPVARVHLGWEDGLVNSKIDWSIGLSQTFGKVGLSLEYIDTYYADRMVDGNGRAGVVGAVRVTF